MERRNAEWTVLTNRGDEIIARYLVTCTGSMAEPKLPGIPGIETFKGHTFHTSRWDYDYTGGDSSGDLTNLADKKVAIVGTGATAIQVVPHLAESAEHLYVVQRTPSSIHFRGDRLTDPEWFENLQPGWQQERMVNFTTAFHGGTVEVDLVDDEWTQSFFDASDVDADGDFSAHQLANFRKMEFARARVDETVEKPEVAEALKPWYNFFCKRPCFHDGYLPAFNRDNVTLVNTDGKGMERVDETGFWVGETHYGLIVLFFPPDSKSAPATSRAPALLCAGGAGRRSTNIGATACARCTASTFMASPIISTSAGWNRQRGRRTSPTP